MKNIKETISDGLENMAINMAVHSISVFFWGETEMPDCLRKEIEQKDEEVM